MSERAASPAHGIRTDTTRRHRTAPYASGPRGAPYSARDARACLVRGERVRGVAYFVMADRVPAVSSRLLRLARVLASSAPIWIC
jgi:hypothetical protein